MSFNSAIGQYSATWPPKNRARRKDTRRRCSLTGPARIPNRAPGILDQLVGRPHFDGILARQLPVPPNAFSANPTCYSALEEG